MHVSGHWDYLIGSSQVNLILGGLLGSCSQSFAVGMGQPHHRLHQSASP